MSQMVGTKTRALAKKAQAVELYREGRTFDEIAQQVGWANRGTAYRVIRSAFQDNIMSDIALHRQVEKQRLDAVMIGAWAGMMRGDVASQRVVLECIELRAKLLGLFDDPHAGIKKIRVNPILTDPDEEVFIGRTGGAYVLDHGQDGYEND